MTHRPRLAATLLLVLSIAGCQTAGEARQSREASPRESSQPSGPIRVYVGTYTGKVSKGIYLMEMDPKTGSLSEPKLAAETKSPSFLALHPNRKVLYAVGESDEFKGQKSGAVSAFAINDDGTLTLINAQPSGGTGPCHLDVDPAGRNVLVANYGGGSVAVLPIDANFGLRPPAQVVQHEGKSVNPRRQEGPHAHCVTLIPASFAVVADLGLDKTFVYRYDPAQSSLHPHAVAEAPPGSGPRHMAPHPSGRWFYVNNELTSTVSVFGMADGPPKELQNVTTLPPGYDGSKNSTAEIAVHPGGKYVYVSNRGHDSIAVFKADPQTGKLTPAGHQSTQGKTPRNFAIAPGGQFLLAANQGSDNVVVFRIDQGTGALTPAGTSVSVPTPVCVTFVP